MSDKNIKKIIELLNMYISEYEENISKYNLNMIKLDLYQEIIPLLNEDLETIKENKIVINIIIDTIYPNNVYTNTFINALFNQKNMEIFKNDILNDYQKIINETDLLKKQIKNNKSNVYILRKNMYCLKKRATIINNKTIIAVIRYYEQKGIIDEKESILLINELYYYNKNIVAKRNDFEPDIDYNDVPFILNSGFEMFDIIEIHPDRKALIDPKVDNLYSLMKTIDKDEFISQLNNYKSYYDFKEFTYIVNELIKKTIFESISIYELFIDKTLYKDKAFKNDAIKEYYLILDYYLFLRNYYHSLENTESYEVEVDEEIDEDVQDKRVVFAHPVSNPTKARFIDDLKDVTEENYQRVEDLIKGFLNGTVTPKRLVNSSIIKGYLELKDDQIRIIMKHIKNSIYCIVGVATKKMDNDVKMLHNMCRRNLTRLDTEEDINKELALADITLKTFEKMVLDEGRKSSR